MKSDFYDAQFFDSQQSDSLESARAVLPIVFSLVSPRSVLDVGCGVGTWLAAARELGVTDILGIDGEYVNRSMLHIPQECFRPADLAKPFNLEHRFDLVISMEVAEHLPPESAEGFVASLVRAAPVVFMSAAIPGQGGVNHINERWQDYWVKLFGAHEYCAIDAVRATIWNHLAVQPYYAQNCLLYASREAIERFPKLAAAAQALPSLPLRVVHPKAYIGLHNWTHPNNISLKSAWRQFKHSMRRAIARRLGRTFPPFMLEA